jgi:hypothetical protein
VEANLAQEGSWLGTNGKIISKGEIMSTINPKPTIRTKSASVVYVQVREARRKKDGNLKISKSRTITIHDTTMNRVISALCRSVVEATMAATKETKEVL